MRSRRQSPVAVQLQQINNLSINKNKALDQPPPKSILNKIEKNLFNTSDPKIQQIQLITQPFFGYISPLNPYLLLWDLTVIIAIYVFLFEMGFLLGFTSQFWISLKSFSYSLGLYATLLIIFVVDIGVNFNKGFYQFGKGRIIIDREVIVKKYLKKMFIIDIISLICVILPLITPSIWNLLQLLFFLKYMKKQSYQQQIRRGLDDYPNTSLVLSLIILFADAMLVSHYIAVIFLRIDIGLWNTQFYGDNTSLYWLSNNADYTNNLMGGAWYLQYIYAQDYSAGTLSTLAPGPFPKNPLEVMYAIFIMIFLIILSSFLAENVVRIFYWETEQRVNYENDILSFTRFLQMKKVENTIKYKTQNYFELVWQSEGKINKKSESRALSKLSSKLRKQLTSQIMNFRYLRFISYFKYHQKQLQEQIIPYIHSRMTDAHQILFQPENEDLLEHKHQVFIISSGNVKLSKVLPNGEQKILGLTNTQKILGVYEFLTDQDYFYTVHTLHVTHFHYMCREDFVAIVEKLKLREIFCELLYNVQIERRLHLLGKYCAVCVGDHLERDCPSIMFSKKVKLALRYYKPLIDDYQDLRGAYKRRNTKNSTQINKKQQTNQNNSNKTDNPLEFLNSLLLNRYIHKLITNSEQFQQCHMFQHFYPKYNISKLLLD